jgi:hypothetical protein
MSAERAKSAQMVAAYDLNESLAAWFECAVGLFRPHLDEGFASLLKKFGVASRTELCARGLDAAE